jgi:hypothetical protein
VSLIGTTKKKVRAKRKGRIPPAHSGSAAMIEPEERAIRGGEERNGDHPVTQVEACR